MHRLKRLINDHEDWLIDRVVRYARENDYTRYTSTLREAWRASIIGLSQPLVAALEEMPTNGHPPGAPIRAAVAFGVEEARKHRGRGIDMGLFLGLMKFYRRTYFDLVEEKVPALDDRGRLTAVLLEMFDSIELGLVRAWVGAGETAELDHLRKKNRELSNEKNKYLTVFESIAEPTILLDQNDEPLHVNAAGGRILLGEDTPGASYYGHPDTDRLRRLVAEILARAGRGDSQGDQIRLDTAIGARTFSIAIQEMLDISRKFAGRVIILRDVTDYLAAIAAAEDANRARSAFLATVSHEIKTPINSIIGLTELLGDSTLSAAQQRHVDAIGASGKLLSELTENILGLSRSEANALQRNEQDFDLWELTKGLVQLVRPEADARGLSIALDLAPTVPCRVRGDAQKVRHVLLNLLSNALKYTSRGGVTLRVDLRSGATAERPEVAFSVEDTGVGLPDGPNDWLFDPFTQYAHPELERSPRGTGLGLAICKRLVGFLGGTIRATARPQGGSVFAFDLPFSATAVRPAMVPKAAALDVLVVEDDPVNALVAEGYVTDLGHAPVVVHAYGAALDALRSQRFDLVLTDNRLDGATGIDLARYLRRAEDPRLNALPVVVVTAALPGATEELSHLVQQFVEKPFDKQDLDRAIDAAIGSRDAISRPDRPTAAPKPDRAQTPLLETRVLNQLLTDLGAERCGRIVDSYLSNAPHLFKALARSVAANDLVSASAAAHKLISAASFVGLTPIASDARALHRSCAARNTRDTRTINARLQALHPQATEALTRHWQYTLDSHGISVSQPRSRKNLPETPPQPSASKTFGPGSGQPNRGTRADILARK